MSWHDEDEFLLQQLRVAVEGTELIPSDFATAAEAALSWRTVDAELLLRAEDATLATGAGARNLEEFEPQVLEFRGRRISIEIELTDNRVEGRILPAQPCRVTKASRAGDVSHFEMDESGSFHFPVRGHETFQLQFDAGDALQVTEWLTP